MGKIVEVGIGIAVLIMMVSWFIMPIAMETTTDPFIDNFNTGTGAGETTETVTLTQSHYYDTHEEMSVASDNSNDDPAILTYNNTNEQVQVGGLVQSGSRILAVTYVVESESLDIFTGYGQVILILPALIIIVGVWKLFQSGFMQNMFRG